MDNLGDLRREEAAAGLERVTAPHAKPYGMGGFEVWDPNGNLLRFGEIGTAGP